MTVKYVVACDGSEASRRALDLAVDLAGSSGASVIVAHVLEWSPYSFLTPTELEERHKRRGEELKRAKEALLDPLVKSIEGRNIEVETIIKYGHVAETLAEITSNESASQLFIGRTGESTLAVRVFGSVAGTLAQITTVPCTIVP
ncbi:MAG: universal stress protein [Gammaproteobacteria bacterium]|nr:universal stress protein [Gammaproteobacteria bacterium]